MLFTYTMLRDGDPGWEKKCFSEFTGHLDCRKTHKVDTLHNPGSVLRGSGYLGYVEVVTRVFENPYKWVKNVPKS